MKKRFCQLSADSSDTFSSFLSSLTSILHMIRHEISNLGMSSSYRLDKCYRMYYSSQIDPQQSLFPVRGRLEATEDAL